MDVLYDEGEEYVFSAPRVQSAQTHGAGCAFSAALTAYLAHRELMHDAVQKAKNFVYQAMAQSVPVGRHHPLNFRWAAGVAETE